MLLTQHAATFSPPAHHEKSARLETKLEIFDREGTNYLSLASLSSSLLRWKNTHSNALFSYWTSLKTIYSTQPIVVLNLDPQRATEERISKLIRWKDVWEKIYKKPSWICNYFPSTFYHLPRLISPISTDERSLCKEISSAFPRVSCTNYTLLLITHVVVFVLDDVILLSCYAINLFAPNKPQYLLIY